MTLWTRPSRCGVSIRIAAWSTDSSKGEYGNPMPSIGSPPTSLLQCHLNPSLCWSPPPDEVTSFLSLHSFIDLEGLQLIIYSVPKSSLCLLLEFICFVLFFSQFPELISPFFSHFPHALWSWSSWAFFLFLCSLVP